MAYIHHDDDSCSLPALTAVANISPYNFWLLFGNIIRQHKGDDAILTLCNNRLGFKYMCISLFVIYIIHFLCIWIFLSNVAESTTSIGSIWKYFQIISFKYTNIWKCFQILSSNTWVKCMGVYLSQCLSIFKYMPILSKYISKYIPILNLSFQIKNIQILTSKYILEKLKYC